MLQGGEVCAAGLFPEFEHLEAYAGKSLQSDFQEVLKHFAQEARLDGTYFFCRQEGMEMAAKLLSKVEGLSLQVIAVPILSRKAPDEGRPLPCVLPTWNAILDSKKQGNNIIDPPNKQLCAAMLDLSPSMYIRVSFQPSGDMSEDCDANTFSL